MPSFSVVMPVYNCEAFVADAIRSVIQQEQSPKEIIVVDDGSSDRSAEIVREFGQEINFLQQPNKGCAAARNLGLRHCTGDYVAFLDSDDLWYPWTLKLVGQLIEQHQNPAAIYTALEQFSGSEPPNLLHSDCDDLRYELFQDMLALGKVVGTCVLIVRRDVIEEVGGFVERNMNGTDAEFNLRIGTAPGVVQITHPPMVAYRQHATNVTHNINKSWEGQSYMIEQEQANQYPGGRPRRRDRIAFIATQTRSLSLRLLSMGHRRLANEVYWKTFLWNISLGRWKYLLGYPWVSLCSFVRK